MVDKNVFKMDVSLMQRFRSLQTASASIERLLPKTFASDANFNVNPPVLPKPTIDFGPNTSIPMRHYSAKALVNRASDTSAKIGASSTSSIRQAPNVPKLASTALKQPVTKASLQALAVAAAKTASSSKSSQSTPTSSRLASVGQSSPPAPKSQATTSKPVPIDAPAKSARELKHVMVQKDELYCSRLPADDIAADEWGDNLRCPTLSMTSIESAIKAVVSAGSVEVEQNLSTPVINAKKIGASRQQPGRRLKANQRLSPSRASNDVTRNIFAASSAGSSEAGVSSLHDSVKRPLSEVRDESSALSCSRSRMAEGQAHFKPGHASSTFLPLNGCTDPSNAPASGSVKRARIKITKRRNLSREGDLSVPFASQQSNMDSQLEPSGGWKTERQTTVDDKPAETVHKSWLDVTVASDVGVKEEPVDFVDLLSLPDEPEDASKENEIKLTPNSPSSRLAPICGQSPSKDLSYTEPHESSATICDSLDSAKVNTFEQDISLEKQPSEGHIACAPVNHRLRRRFQQLLDMSSWKKSVPCHTFFKEEPVRPLDASGDKVEKESRPLIEICWGTREYPASLTASTPETSPSRVNPVPHFTAAPYINKATSSRGEVIILDDDDAPLPPLRSAKLNRPCPASAKQSLLPSSYAVSIQLEDSNNNNSNKRLPTPTTTLNNTQPNGTRQVARGTAIPIQRVAPVCMDAPIQQLDNTTINGPIVRTSQSAVGLPINQQHLRLLLSAPPVPDATPATVSETCLQTDQLSRVSAAAKSATHLPSPCSSPVLPPRGVRVPPPTQQAQVGPPTAKLVPTNPPPVIISLPSPPKLAQKAIQHPPLSTSVPSLLNANSVNNNNNNNNNNNDVMGVTQKRAPQRIIPPAQQTNNRQTAQQRVHEQRPHHRLNHLHHPHSVQVQVEHSLTSGHQQPHEHPTPHYQPSQQQQQQQQQQQVQIAQRQQELAQQQQQKQQQRVGSPVSSSNQEQRYQCGYCGLTGVDMRVVAMHIATCGS